MTDSARPVSPTAPAEWLNPKMLAARAVQRLADSEPTEDAIEGTDRLRGTPQESMFVVSAAELERVIECTLEDAIYDASPVAPTAPAPEELNATYAPYGFDEDGPRHSYACDNGYPGVCHVCSRRRLPDLAVAPTADFKQLLDAALRRIGNELYLDGRVDFRVVRREFAATIDALAGAPLEGK